TVPKDPSPRDDEPEEAAGAAVVAAGAAVVATAAELLEELLSSSLSPHDAAIKLTNRKTLKYFFNIQYSPLTTTQT
ncbi:MAG: hypothetical protein VX797_07215, partial [Actinomycetota bacterium]|nr:hypothetical protein [Actinomycetota bacterium]